MARRTREELVAAFCTYAGDRNDDETIALMEDISDSFGDGEDWQAKYEENDRQWRERYLSRFSYSQGGGLEPYVEPHVEDPQEEQKDEVDTPPENETFEELFE